MARRLLAPSAGGVKGLRLSSPSGEEPLRLGANLRGAEREGLDGGAGGLGRASGAGGGGAASGEGRSAVTMPTSRPAASTSGPPEKPGRAPGMRATRPGPKAGRS